MPKTQHQPGKNLSLVFMKSQLICAQSLEIMLDNFLEPVSTESTAAELCEILEEIGNIYLNISENISSLRANDAIFVSDMALNALEPIENSKKITL